MRWYRVRVEQLLARHPGVRAGGLEGSDVLAHVDVIGRSQAADWQKAQAVEAIRQAMAADLVAAFAARIPLTTGQRLLDVGCGTGLIGLPLAERTGRVLGIDVSAGMVERFTAKAAGRPGVAAEVRDLIADPLPAGSVDVAVSAMAFHHIGPVEAMLRALAGCLAPGGWLAIADLESEDGSFHDEPVPHLGFVPAAFLALMRDAGLQPLAQERVHVMRKANGRDYPIFLALARKPAV